MSSPSERRPERATAIHGDATPQPVLRVHSLRVLGIRTRAIEVGHSASSEAVLLLHGNPGSAEDWALIQPRLARIARAVAIDLPGFGDADRPRAWDYSPLSYAEYVGAVIRELGVERVHLVMHDLGGIALLWAVNNQERFASAVLIDTGNLIDFRWHLVARMYRTAGVGELLVALTSRKLFRAALARLNPQPRRLPADVLERVWADYDHGTRRAAMRFYRATPAESMGLLAPALRPLDRPALVIWGRHDPFIPAEQAHLQRESFPGAEVVVFEDSGHWPHIDSAQRATDEIARFLERQFDDHDPGR
jgi:pimeloyl-ACP methyl ester carboxylesterase